MFILGFYVSYVPEAERQKAKGKRPRRGNLKPGTLTLELETCNLEPETGNR
jgi:hypothetical protein